MIHSLLILAAEDCFSIEEKPPTDRIHQRLFAPMTLTSCRVMTDKQQVLDAWKWKITT